MSLQFSGSWVDSSIFGSLHLYVSRVKEGKHTSVGKHLQPVSTWHGVDRGLGAGKRSRYSIVSRYCMDTRTPNIDTSLNKWKYSGILQTISCTPSWDNISFLTCTIKSAASCRLYSCFLCFINADILPSCSHQLSRSTDRLWAVPWL